MASSRINFNRLRAACIVIAAFALMIVLTSASPTNFPSVFAGVLLTVSCALIVEAAFRRRSDRAPAIAQISANLDAPNEMGTLFDIVPDEERGYVERVVALAENDENAIAERLCQEGLKGKFSEEAKAFFHYTLGVVYAKASASDRDNAEQHVDQAIMHLEAALEPIEFGDAWLMLGYSLMDKLGQMGQKPDAGAGEGGREMASLADRAVHAFTEAKHLSKGFGDDAQEQIERLSEFRDCLDPHWRE
jgi:hypothetical protein